MHRITYVSNIDFKPATRQFKSQKAAGEAWAGMNNSHVRYAVWTFGTGIIAELHHVYYLNKTR